MDRLHPDDIEAIAQRTAELVGEKRQRKKKPDIVPVSRFLEFWEAYADKRGRQAAEKAWQTKKLDSIADKVIAGALAYAAARGSERKYWKQAQGWLNDGRWEDDFSGYSPESNKDQRRAEALAWANDDAIEGEFFTQGAIEHER